jgi:RpiR family carbohydrate utilization transcriptional regulator
MVALAGELCNFVSSYATTLQAMRSVAFSGVDGMASDRTRTLENWRNASEDASAPIELVSRIQRIEQELSPAERRVAEAVVADYQGTTLLSIGELARRAGVSQPSVTRFCRTVGCSSFGEFKVRLATTLAVAAVYLKSDRVFDDDAGQLTRSVMLRAADAIREALEQLDTAATTAAIAVIAKAARLDIYG